MRGRVEFSFVKNKGNGEQWEGQSFGSPHCFLLMLSARGGGSAGVVNMTMSGKIGRKYIPMNP